ncbi:methyltransferase domain-containing protein [Patescibacteria group bacterium]|nr:methyltransferase domain-containing protein [Patescibacteria group bacterium]
MKKEKVRKILKQNEKIWELIAEDFSKTRKENWKEIQPFFSFLKKGDKILDLGCGNGRLYQALSPQKIKYIGLDNSKNLIEIARKKFIDSSSQKKFPLFLKGDALRLKAQFPDQEFNAIISIAFLHHIPSFRLRMKIIKDCFDLLKPGGFLMMTVWNLRQWRLINKYQLYSLFWGQSNVFIPWRSGDYRADRYHYAFRLKELKKMFIQAGFQVVRACPETKRGFNLIIIGQKK